jgi:SAM-dependent methyltransferase
MTSGAFTFDHFADDYDAALNEGISISGEDKYFFAEGRISWLKGVLEDLAFEAKAILDFGCGIGSAIPFLIKILNPHAVLGIDPSGKSLRIAQENNDSEYVRFRQLDEYVPDEEIDLAYCNGVFHHIPVEERLRSASYVYRSLKNNGIFAFWETNPWNLGARYCMWKNPFDKDAKAITAGQAKRLLRASGFKVLRTDYLFIFPRTFYDGSDHLKRSSHECRWERSIRSSVRKNSLSQTTRI